jgi:serine-aspartate repeat-containing protein C/D/E
VTLSGAAGPGGVTITLADDNDAATIPASVFIPEGQSSATFPISTVIVGSDTAVIISATLGTVTVQATLNVTAPVQGTQTATATQTQAATQTATQTQTATTTATQMATQTQTVVSTATQLATQIQTAVATETELATETVVTETQIAVATQTQAAMETATETQIATGESTQVAETSAELTVTPTNEQLSGLANTGSGTPPPSAPFAPAWIAILGAALIGAAGYGVRRQAQTARGSRRGRLHTQ